MLFPKYKYTIRVGVWTVTQWLKFVLVLLGVVAAAAYITRGGGEIVGSKATPEISLNSGDARNFTAEVVEITDGDTLDVSGPRGRQKIRLNGIDCPEINQPFGRSAKLLASDLALHKQFTVKANGHDKYGRIIADLVFPDGRVLNHELVKAGMAWWFREYSNDTQLAALEREARTSRIGLWADAEPVAPWEFRNRAAK